MAGSKTAEGVDLVIAPLEMLVVTLETSPAVAKSGARPRGRSDRWSGQG